MSRTKMPTDSEIETRAYQLWERAGKPEGREQDFWRRAERELQKEREEEQEDK